MTGLRKRVTVGFMSIVGVLLLAGAVSYIELSSLSRETDSILTASRLNRQMADNMRSEMHNQNAAFVQMTAFGNEAYDSLCINSLDRLDAMLAAARAEYQRAETIDPMIDSMAEMSKQLRQIVCEYRDRDLLRVDTTSVESVEVADSIGVVESVAMADSVVADSVVVDEIVAEPRVRSAAEYYDDYLPIYDKMTLSIDQFVTLAQSELAPRTEQLHNNAYRAVTPVLISLSVMIVIVLMLFYFMLISCVNPIIEITKALRNYIAFKIPYTPKGVRRDELEQLSQMIEEVVEDNVDMRRK